MLKKEIKEALILSGIPLKKDIVVKTDNATVFSVKLLRIIVFLLCNFFLQVKLEKDKKFDFIMQKFEEILDITTTEIEIVLHNISSEILDEEIELSNKEEIFLAVAVQEKINEKLKKLLYKEEYKMKKYISATQIAKCVNDFLLAQVRTADVNKCLQQLGYLDIYNRPTPKATGMFTVGTNFYRRDYYKWHESIVEEVKEKFYEDSWSV